jgi:DNA-binding response OmpR family regulator
MDRFLEGRRILVLDDEYLAALEVQQTLEDLGAEVVGPLGRLEQAQAVARERMLDGAILDVRLDGKTSYPLARQLLEAKVVVVFLTGYERGLIDAEFTDVPRLTKPYDARQGERILRSAFS